jgi:hypothetical protein
MSFLPHAANGDLSEHLRHANTATPSAEFVGIHMPVSQGNTISPLPPFRMIVPAGDPPRATPFKETNMPILTLGTRSYDVSEDRVRRQAERMFKMNAERRNHRLDRAKTQLARSARETDSEGAAAAAKEAAAVLLSQGIGEI